MFGGTDVAVRIGAPVAVARASLFDPVISGSPLSSIVFAGSAQFIATQLVQAAAPGLVIVLTIAVVNLRHVLYSASLAPYLAALSTRWKALLSYLLTDEAYVPTVIHYGREGVTPHSHWFLLGAGLALWTDWQISTALGIWLASCRAPTWC